ncbi:hypothetical protein SERLA73DRAFT_45253 [Serpula lacrymans var. lacrymans S7.3]|uniref:Uncharacterized protein n=1 Tax=Serpula lacrymans var. lacrymans (strain S7.3) TaxID=936435 RepID=F8PGS8_SERL3|nr:hypothetical protein SERLA73DRAFT_45253 [Serpula lacrymans var. lacrymans S7.3]
MHGHPVFILKHNVHGYPSCIKARYVCKGFTTILGCDYHKTTSPTARLESFCLLLHLVATFS